MQYNLEHAGVNVHKQIQIRLLGTSSNECGDLFTRLAGDLFFSLGYDNLQFDLAKSGREIDIQGEHRFEFRRVTAECKAHASAIGGGDINKFLGVLTRERGRHNPQPVSGYFVSLGGFTGTAEEQERESGHDAIILLDAKRTVTELQKSRVIVSLTEAAERAGRCAERCQLTTAQLDGAELLVHPSGYLWAIYFARNKQRTHFSLVHADGTPLAEDVATTVICADKSAGGSLHAITYLAPAVVINIEELQSEALNQYRSWLGEECGYIQLDGLPADSDLSATKLRLEKLFVPLNVTHKQPSSPKAPAEPKPQNVAGPTADPPNQETSEEEPEDPLSLFETIDPEKVEPIGRLLGKINHLAILANPGGGKSTLVKRLATAYSFPSRRVEVEDELPDRPWLPLYLRCRDMRDRSNRPVLELLHGIAAFANMNDRQARCFEDLVGEALRAGNALLLVDGLDEISDESARRTFAQNLRTFVAMFPTSALVITSRVAGFRDVAGVIAGACHKVTLAPLEEDDVRRLCISWHTEVMEDTVKIRTEASELATRIWANRHLRSLVENPLLLTTLLVVKRSNGEIPPTRAELYYEAVRVLVRTWNVEGYSPLDERETLARLSYVACSMMQGGAQLIGYSALVKLLHEAAREMEPELQFAKVSPTEFIQRIEYRSSLLMQTGYQRLDGEMQPVFEFRHLTFQEYLAARGFVSEQYPGRNDEAPLVEILSPHIGDVRWQEVIPLAAVIAGRKADPIIKHITGICTSIRTSKNAESESLGTRANSLLGRCLLEEVALTPSTLRTALLEVGYRSPSRRPIRFVESLLRGKFGVTFRSILKESYLSAGGDWTYFDAALSAACRIDAEKSDAGLEDCEIAEGICNRISGGTREEQICAAFRAMRIAFECKDDAAKIARLFGSRADAFRIGLSQMILSQDLPRAQAAAWALAWFGSARVWRDPIPAEVMKQLLSYWREQSAPELVRKAAWAFSTQPLFPRDESPISPWAGCDDWVRVQLNLDNQHQNSRAGIVVAWYLRRPWTDAELADLIEKHCSVEHSNAGTFRGILSMLGENGKIVLEHWDKEGGT